MKKILISLLTLLFIFNFQITSKADNAVGSYSYVTVFGHEYEYHSSVTVNSGKVWSHTLIKSNEGENLPSGYMGVHARLYNSSGTLVAYSGWVYNNTSCGGISNMTSRYYTNSGDYYGRGQVKIYNGNGYNTYTTTRSPILQAYSLRDLKNLYNVNEKGEIYGSELFLEQFNKTPDLIEVLGDNGNIGYVKSSDLNKGSSLDTLQEVIEYQNDLPNERKIIVYESDGITSIDTFTIYHDIENIIVY